MGHVEILFNAFKSITLKCNMVKYKKGEKKKKTKKEKSIPITRNKVIFLYESCMYLYESYFSFLFFCTQPHSKYVESSKQSQVSVNNNISC